MPQPRPLVLLSVFVALGCKPTSDAPPRAEAKAEASAKVDAPPPSSEVAAPAPRKDAKADAKTNAVETKASDETNAPEAEPTSPPPVVSPGAIRIAAKPDDTTIDADDGSSCAYEMLEVTGLPAVRGDGERIAMLTIEGPNAGDDISFDYDLVLLERSGATIETIELWTPARLESIPDAAACRKANEDFRGLLAKTEARFSTGGWTSMERLPAHVDLTRDFEVPAASCKDSMPSTALDTGDPLPPLVTCANKPRTLEVALTGGPTLALRVPGVKVWHRQPASDLRVPITDEWEKGMCSSAPAVDDGWHSSEHRLVLLRFDGQDMTMDACGYRRVHRVLDLPKLELPELPWSRSPSPVDLMLAGEQLPLP